VLVYALPHRPPLNSERTIEPLGGEADFANVTTLKIIRGSDGSADIGHITLTNSCSELRQFLYSYIPVRTT